MSKLNLGKNCKVVNNIIYFPVLFDDKLKVYEFSKEWLIEEYIESIKDKYSYKDIIVCEDDICKDSFSIPFRLQYGNGKRYDVGEFFVSDICTSDKVGGSRKCNAIAEVNYYPKIYVLLKECLKNNIIDLRNIANYFKEYLGREDYIYDEREIIKNSLDSIPFNSIEIGPVEKESNILDLIEEIKKIFFSTEITMKLEKEFDVFNENVLIDINMDLAEFKLLKECYYVGKNNKKAINYIKNDLPFEIKKSKVYKK